MYGLYIIQSNFLFTCSAISSSIVEFSFSLRVRETAAEDIIWCSQIKLFCLSQNFHLWYHLCLKHDTDDNCINSWIWNIFLLPSSGTDKDKNQKNTFKMRWRNFVLYLLIFTKIISRIIYKEKISPYILMIDYILNNQNLIELFIGN